MAYFEYSTQSLDDLNWLKKRLGYRFRGPFLDEDEHYFVELIRLNHRRSCVYGGTLDVALASARRIIESAVKDWLRSDE
jgi:hypothetical protein